MSLPASETDIDGFVLAGGQSSRMGQDKALIQLAGVPLIQHALGILRGARLVPRIAGAGAELSSLASVIADEPQGAGLGPLSGICSALLATAARYGVFLPVDLPLIPASLVSCLIDHATITQSAVTVVSVAGFIQTFPAVIAREAAPELHARLHSTDRKCLTAFQAAANRVRRRFSVLPIEFLLQAGHIRAVNGPPASEWFLNINTPQDLATAGALLKGRDQVS